MKYLFILLSLLFCEMALAQPGASAIQGTAYDDSGEAVPFANVSLNDSIGTTTDIDGKFRFNNLPVGKYTVTVTYVGYPAESEEVHLKKPGVVYKVDITLSPGAVLLKPAIYMYSEETKDVTLRLGITEGLIFTHPKYTGSWEVTVDGDQIRDGEQSYDYLFWESQQTTENQTAFNSKEGFCISGGEAVNFLETSARQLGFNARETNDFVSFWGPRISELNYALIHFKVDDAYDEVMPIEVIPQPDVSRRVFMLVQPLDKRIYLEAQEFAPLDRKGFVLIEWGGSVLDVEMGL